MNLNSRPLLLTLLIALCLSLSSDAYAKKGDKTKEPPQVQKIAFINLRVIIEGYKSFQEDIAALKDEVKEREAQVKERQAAIQQQMQVAQTLEGEAQVSMVEEIQRAQSDLQILVQSTKRLLTTKESDIYAKAYKSIRQTVTTYARKNGIVAVFNLKEKSLEEDMSNPGSVLQRINREAFWIEPENDITDNILEELNGEEREEE